MIALEAQLRKWLQTQADQKSTTCWRAYVALAVIQTVAVVAAVPAAAMRWSGDGVDWWTVTPLAVAGVLVATASTMIAAYGDGRAVAASRAYSGGYWLILLGGAVAISLPEPTSHNASSVRDWIVTLAAYGMLALQTPHVVRAAEAMAVPAGDQRRGISLARLRRATHRKMWLRSGGDYAIRPIAQAVIGFWVFALIVMIAFEGTLADSLLLWTGTPLAVAAACKLLREAMNEAWSAETLTLVDVGEN